MFFVQKKRFSETPPQRLRSAKRAIQRARDGREGTYRSPTNVTSSPSPMSSSLSSNTSSMKDMVGMNECVSVLRVTCRVAWVSFQFRAISTVSRSSPARSDDAHRCDTFYSSLFAHRIRSRVVASTSACTASRNPSFFAFDASARFSIDQSTHSRANARANARSLARTSSSSTNRRVLFLPPPFFRRPVGRRAPSPSQRTPTARRQVPSDAPTLRRALARPARASVRLTRRGCFHPRGFAGYFSVHHSSNACARVRSGACGDRRNVSSATDRTVDFFSCVCRQPLKFLRASGFLSIEN